MGLGTKLLSSLVKSAFQSHKRKSILDDSPSFYDTIPSLSNPSEPPEQRSRREALERLNANKPKEGLEKPVIHEEPKKAPPPKPLTDDSINMTEEERREYALGVLGSIALCWYIAGVDGKISPLEYDALGDIMMNFKENPKIPAKYKGAIDDELVGKNVTFDTVTRYLDHADNAYLLSVVLRAEWIANYYGTTSREKDAIDALKFYVEKRTGHRYDNLYQEAKQIDLNCPTCGAIMDLDDTMLKAFCSHCGFTRIIDANQIHKVMAEQERTKRLQADPRVNNY